MSDKNEQQQPDTDPELLSRVKEELDDIQSTEEQIRKKSEASFQGFVESALDDLKK